MKKIILILASGFGIGYLPKLPGTFASLFGLFIYCLIKENIFLFTLLVILLLPISVFIAHLAEKYYSQKDCQKIVIDEIIGMLLALFMLPLNKYLVIFGFFSFRVFDILKPFPIRKLQNLKGGIGIVADDVWAAIYTSLLLKIMLFMIKS